MNIVDRTPPSHSLDGAGGRVAGRNLNQEDFLRLMIEQFRAQDPTKPMDNAQFVGQMAQFSQITATQQMQASFDFLANAMAGDQVLRAANLIGREVLVPSDEFVVTDAAQAAPPVEGEDGADGADAGETPAAPTRAPLAGAINVPGAMGNVRVTITDSHGKVVRTLDLGPQQPGLARFEWDGLDADGNAVPPGSYSIAAGTPESPLGTYVSGLVTGIGSTGNATYLQVAGIGGVLLNQVAQII